MSKLAIDAETDEDRFDTTATVRCYACHANDVDRSLGKLPIVIDGVIKALTFSRLEEIKAWEQEFVPCEHSLYLQQELHKAIKPEGMIDFEQAEYPWPVCSACYRRSITVFHVRP